MGLISREVTANMKEANRANGQKSTGPRTEQGKRNSRWSAFRHGVFGHELCPWTEELDEDAADYRRFCRRYLDAFQVGDEVEALLVADMARTQWRLERVLHAESACLAWRRRTMENEHRRTLAREGMGVRTALEKILSRQAGYAALPESEGKYELILLLLHTVRIDVETEGYTEMGAQCLESVYGRKPGVAKTALLIDFDGLQPDADHSEAMQEHLRKEFLGKLKEEVGNFKTLRECLRTERGKLFEMEMDSKLTLSEKAAKVVAAEENRLRNYLQQTFKQLTAWRQRPGQEGPVQAVSGGQPADGPGPSAGGAAGAVPQGETPASSSERAGPSASGPESVPHTVPAAANADPTTAATPSSPPAAQADVEDSEPLAEPANADDVATEPGSWPQAESPEEAVAPADVRQPSSKQAVPADPTPSRTRDTMGCARTACGTRTAKHPVAPERLRPGG